MSLVTAEEVIGYAGIDEPEDPLIQRLIDQVEAAFHRATGRVERPMQGEEAGRLEIRDGTGCRELYLDYPIKALATDITFGYASPWDATIDPTDTTVLVWRTGSRRLTRIDGGIWGPLDQPLYVRVTYDTQADLPEDVKLAVSRMVGSLYRESGRSEATAERALAESEGLPTVADVLTNDLWRAAIEAHRETRV